MTGKFLRWFMGAMALMFASSATAGTLQSLQPLIDAAKAGDTITPPPGIYQAPLIITKALILDGGGKVTLDGGGKGSIIVLKTDGATLRGLRLVNTGESHNDIDAGIQVRGNYNVIKDNVIADNLFGIELQQAHNNVVMRNRIGSKPFDLGVRGDGIRLWYSHDNRIEENHISGSRDTVVWYSRDNIIARNRIEGGRYGLHFMYSLFNRVEYNEFKGNSVGVFLMYSDSVELRGNHISRGQGATGMGIGMKETSNVIIEDNTIVYCATGIYLDVSPFQPDTTNRIRRNHLAFNNIGILFHNDWTGNVLEGNRIENNFVQVSVNAGASAKRNQWDGNYWDDYRGFDLDADGVGDTPYTLQIYADRLWMDVPPASFFKGSAILSLLDFLERLAPFSEPIMLLSDARPAMTAKLASADMPVTKSKDRGADDALKYDPFGLKKRVPKYMGEKGQK
jgi:nitrous oxidase accessory protein